MALYITCDVSPLSKVHRMLTLDTETSSMLISTLTTVEAVRPKAISKLSAMFCNHSCRLYASILGAIAHTLCSAWALGACDNSFLYITRTYIYNENYS